MSKQKLQISKGFKAERKRVRTITLMLLSIVLLLALLSLMIGNTYYSIQDLYRVVFQEGISSSFTIYTLRLPRMLNGILCGMAFGMAGNTFQKLLRNPLASPDIIGVSAGSSIGAILCILVFQLSGAVVSFAAVISALVTALMLFLLAKKQYVSNVKLILIGIGLQAFLNAVISFILLRAAQYDVASALRWLSGSLNNVTMDHAFILGICVIVIGSILIVLGRYLMIMQLGDAFATTLGVNINRMKFVMFLCALLLIAFATSVSGPIASVAFLSGPIAVKVIKGNSSHIIQAGFIGAILVLGANLIAQNAFDARYPVGVITGLLGAPYLILQLLKWNRKEERIE